MYSRFDASGIDCYDAEDNQYVAEWRLSDYEYHNMRMHLYIFKYNQRFDIDIVFLL